MDGRERTDENENRPSDLKGSKLTTEAKMKSDNNTNEDCLVE